MSRRARLLVACLLVLLPTLPARAQDHADHEYRQNRLANDTELNQSRAEIEQLDVEQAVAGQRIDELRLSTAELEAEAARTADLVALSEARLSNLEARQELGIELLEAAALALQRAEDDYAAQRALAAERLVNMYVFSTEHRTALSWEVSDVHDLENRHVILTMVGEHDKELLESLDEAVAEIAHRREVLEAIKHGVDQLARQEAETLVELNATRIRQAALQAELEERIRLLHTEIDALEQAQVTVEAIMGERIAEIQLEADERDRLRQICFATPRQPLDGDGSWIDCPGVGVVIPPDAVRWPLNSWVTSEYGPRWGRMHEGIDIAGAHGAPIASAESGRVAFAGWIGGYGNTVVIDHGGGMSTLYGHMESVAVLTGQTVTIGQAVGSVGNSGFSRGPHLHFEVRLDGVPLNPRRFLP